MQKLDFFENNIYIAHADCSVFSDSCLFDKWYSKLPNFRKEKVDNFVFDKDKFLSLGAWTLLKVSLDKFNIDINLQDLQFGKFEKPYFKDCCINFNLSHSGTKVLCAMSKDEIGCDVETIKPYDDALADFCMTKNEIANFETCKKNKEKSNLFYDFWTIKESIIKCMGTGLNLNPKYIEIKYKGSFDNLQYSIKNTNEKIDTRLKIYKFNCVDDYSFACCDSGKQKNLVVEKHIFS